MKRSVRRIAFLQIPIMLLGLFSQTPGQDTMWLRRLDTGTDEFGNGIAARSGAIAVSGSWLGSTVDCFVVRYSDRGDTTWTRVYDTGFTDQLIDASIDPEGNICAAGLVQGLRLATGPRGLAGMANGLKGCCGAGLASWLAGLQELSLVVLKYDSTGWLKWDRVEPGRLGFGVATDETGNCYVSGAFFSGSGFDFHLAKYDPSGDTIWSKTFDFSLIDFFYRLTLDGSGCLLATGYTGDGYTSDCIVAKFKPSGDTIWTRVVDLGESDGGVGVATDLQDNVVAVGFSGAGETLDILVLKYDSLGTLLWTGILDRAPTDQALGVTCDSAGNVFVAAYSGEMYSGDFLAVKYSPDGDTLWTRAYDNNFDDMAYDVALDPLGNPVFTGASQNLSFYYDVLTIKYHSNTGIGELVTAPPQPRDKVRCCFSTTSEITLELPVAGYYRISLCDLSGRRGRLVHDGPLESGERRFPLPSLRCGVHVVIIESPQGRVAVKSVVLGD